MIKTAFKSVLAHKVRLVLTAVAIILGVSLVTGTFIFTDTITKQFDTLLDEIYSGTDVSVRAETGDFSAGTEPFPANVLADVEQVDGVAVADGGVASLTAQVLDRDGMPIGGQGPPTLGFSWGETPSLNPMKIKDDQGRAPEGPGEVVLDANTVSSAGFAVGDTVTIVGFEGPDEFELVGVASFGDQDSLLGATIVLFELEEAMRVFGFDDELAGISVQAEPGVDSEQLAMDIAAVLPTGVEAVTGETEQNEQAADINEGLGFLSIGLLAFAGVSIFVGAFIIQNTFRIIIAQRTRELALLRAIGATGRQVRWMVLVEAFFVGLFGSIVGIVVGFAMALGIRGLMNLVGLGIPSGSLVLLPRTVIVGMAVGLILTMASALLPARKASKIPPVAALREDAARTPRRSLHTRALAGSAVLGLGVVFLFLGLFTGIGRAIVLVGLGAAVSFIGVSVLAPLAAKPLANIIGWPLPRLFGVAGQLARENTKRKPRRTASTASALMVGVALVAFFTVFASSTKASVSETVFELFPADLALSSTIQSDPELLSPMSPSLVEELKTYDELSVVSGMQFGRILIDGDTHLLDAFDPETIGQVFFLDPNDDALSLVAEVNSMIVATSFLESQGWVIGDTITIEYLTTGEVATVIVGSFESDDFSNMYVSTETYIENFRYQGDGFIFANAADGVTVDEAQSAIAPTIDRYGNVKAQSKSEIVTDAEMQIDQALALFTGLLFFAVIIAVLGITNTLTLSVYERTREIGLLRAVGMVRRQVRRMIRWEAVIVATFGAILGVLIGIILGWSVVRALADEGFGAFAIPYGQVLLALVLAAVAGVLAAIWPARKASRMNVLDAIRTE
ncbi:MAG: FtsX-like permease family protein [Actinomycetia bacterium]|nr:FtsX-like permease family protein [Actinomycetes bacterium]